MNFKSGILWQIQAQNGSKSYIFGTLHLYPQSEIKLSNKVVTSLKECSVLTLERKSGSQAEHQKLSQFQMPNFVLENHKIIVAEYGDDLTSMERELIGKALELEIEVTGLESPGKTLNILQAVGEIKNDKIKFTKDQILMDYKKSVSQYKTGSIDRYYKNVAARFGNEMTQILIDERNKDWIEDIENFIETDKTFIAVGIAHLGGESGILNLLAKKGYQIKKVE